MKNVYDGSLTISNISTFQELLKKDWSVSIQTWNFLKFLVTEMYKLAKGISPAMMQEILKFRNNKIYHLRSQNTFEIPFRNSLYNGNKSISCLIQKFGNLCHIT